MIDFVLKDKCYGCTACASVCKNEAIKMQMDDEGFWSPTIDRYKCVECGACKAVCPSIACEKNPKQEFVYSATIKDEVTLKRSTSGGLGYELARHVVEDLHGVAVGCTMDGFEAKHIIVESIEDLKKIQGSKYVQSYLGNIFLKIEQILSQGRKIIFFGTPCQVAGLKNFIKKNDNLITIDLVCQGVPSPGIFQRYIQDLRADFPEAATCTFRDKEDIWTGDRASALSLYTSQGRTILRWPMNSSVWTKAFLSNAINRKSCSTCQFTSIDRVGDISLGDFWGIDEYKKELWHKDGVSLIFINNEVGRRLIQSFENKLEKYERIPVQHAVKHNSMLNQPGHIDQAREDIIEAYKNNQKISDVLNKKFYRIGIMNLWLSENFGAVLVMYSLYNFIKKLGYRDVKPIQFLDDNKMHMHGWSKNFREFRKKYLAWKYPDFVKERSFLYLQEEVSKKDVVIVGSDQIWQCWDPPKYLLGWASGWKNFIAYSASTGSSWFNKELYQDGLEEKIKRFDAISLREKGLQSWFKERHLPIQWTIDPTLLLEEKDYQRIIDDDPKSQDIPKDKYVGIHLMYDEDQKNKLFNDQSILYCLKQRFKLVDLYRHNDDFSSVGRWLNGIKNAEYVITNSFHAIVFSIMFQKKFIFVEVCSSPDRIMSLFEMLNIDKKRYCKTLDDINLDLIDQKIDYDQIYKNIFDQRLKSIEYLSCNMSKNLNFKKKK